MKKGVDSTLKLYKDALVVKSNELIEAKSKFTANEYKVINCLIGHIDKDDKSFDDFDINVKDINKQLGNSKNTQGTYSYVKKYAYSLASRNITVKKDNNEIAIYNYFSIVETYRGCLNVCFNNKLERFLLNTKSKFTRYRLSNILNLDTFYEIRLYEILKQYEKVGLRDVKYSDLRFMLGIEDNQIKRFCDFRSRVIEKALDKINKKTDIKTRVDIEKAGRNTSFRFYIVGQDTIYMSKELIQIKEDIEKVIGSNVQTRMLENVIKKHELKKADIDSYLKNWDKFKYKTKENPVGFFLNCVINKIPIPERQQGNYKPSQAYNFEQREYDDEFFESLYDNF